ncbi:MAG: DUF5946 family protein [Candidatus Limnocylindria bacterium]
MKTAALVLAAGASRRFGSPKQLARIGNRTMLQVVLDAARVAGLDPIVVVAPSSIGLPSGVVGVANDEPDAGMSASLRLGFHAVGPEVDRIIVLLGDQPTVGPGLIREMRAMDSAGRPLVALHSAGRLAPPVLVTRDGFGLVDGLDGDEGFRGVLTKHPELVTPFAVTSHPVDIDSPEELELFVEPCPGCGALLAPMRDTPSHEYIGASPACWVAFGELLAREFGDPSYGVIHRHTVDVYAAQHPGVDGPRQRQSVAIHLISMALWLERGWDPQALLPITRRLTENAGGWPWLAPPPTYALSIDDVLRATSGEDHVRRVHGWADAVWAAWQDHHATVRGWAQEAIAK